LKLVFILEYSGDGLLEGEGLEKVQAVGVKGADVFGSEEREGVEYRVTARSRART